jgi:phosphoribosylformimino-5-aminoimidazole carboxamide ribotide isomerase
MRDESSIQAGLSTGVARVIIGTKAAEPGFLETTAGQFGASRLAVGIDAKDGKVAVKGWVETMELTAVELARRAVTAGIRTIIYTDIATDGMLQGPNLVAMREMVSEVPCDLIASGGVSGPQDIRDLAAVPGIHGAIIGRALYEGRMPEDLRTILK